MFTLEKNRTLWENMSSRVENAGDILHRRGYPNRQGYFVPRANQEKVSGANVTKWVKENKTLVLVAGAAIVGGLVWYMWYSKKNATAGAQVSRRRAVLGGQVAAAPAPAPTPAPAQVAPQQQAVSSMDPAACGLSGVPKPFNVFQDDLVGANDMSSGAGPAPFSAGGSAGVPIDYAGQSGPANPSAVWQSSTLLPSNCGQALEGTSDWTLYAPSNAQVTSVIGAGQLYGQDTIMTSLKNASLDLRPEPAIPNAACSQVPFNQSSWVDTSNAVTNFGHSLIA